MSGATFGTLSVHLDEDARVGCHCYPDRGPILFIDGVGVALTVSARTHTRATAGDVANARALADAVMTYLAEVERLHAQTSADSTPDSGSETGDRAAGSSVAA